MILPKKTALFIKQKKEFIEILSGFESANTYMIMDEQENALGYIVEERKGLSSTLSRLFLGSSRGFTMTVTDANGSPWISFERKATFWMSEIFITDLLGNRLGSIKREFSILKRIYTILSSKGAQLGTVFSNWNELYTFHWSLSSVTESGKITKKWNGVLKELFTDADTFKVEFPSSLTDEQYQAIIPYILATGVSIDMDFFENNHN